MDTSLKTPPGIAERKARDAAIRWLFRHWDAAEAEQQARERAARSRKHALLRGERIRMEVRR